MVSFILCSVVFVTFCDMISQEIYPTENKKEDIE